MLKTGWLMTARDWFESIRADVVELRELEYRVLEVESKLGPHSQRMGSIGGGGNPDKMRPIDRLVDSGLREKLEAQRSKVIRRVEHATSVLYGESGRGGLARESGSFDADILTLYYLQGETWADVARMVNPDSPCPAQWCRSRALRALGKIDRLGADALEKS